MYFVKCYKSNEFKLLLMCKTDLCFCEYVDFYYLCRLNIKHYGYLQITLFREGYPF